MSFNIGLFFLGLGLITTSLFKMLFDHEFGIYEITFILGVILSGLSYRTPIEEKKHKTNMEALNKSIQNLNDILWGEKKKEDVIKLTPEQYWQVSVQGPCPDIGITWGACYCYYGGKRGYCIFERCPRRIK